MNKGTPADPPENLHLKVRGVALWIKTLKGEARSTVQTAFETLLLAADALATKPAEPSVQPPAPEPADLWYELEGVIDDMRAGKTIPEVSIATLRRVQTAIDAQRGAAPEPVTNCSRSITPPEDA